MATDWIKEWLAYESLTGKRPSQSDPESKNIYFGVYKGVRDNRKGYREFWAEHRIKETDWIAEWEAFEARTGRRPSAKDPESSNIYWGTQMMAWRGYPRYVAFFEYQRVHPTDWIKEWKDYVKRTGKRPSKADPDSRGIYNGVSQGAKDGRPGYKEFLESARSHRAGTDWLSAWVDYERRTGKRPSRTDPDSRRIYSGVHQGARNGRPGYKEFFAAHRIGQGVRPAPIDWIKEWEDYEARTGKRPSQADPESKRIYVGVEKRAARGLPGYREFFDAHRAKGPRAVRTDWTKEWEDYVKRTGKRPSATNPDSKRIYAGVFQGAQRGRPGYREFWEANRVIGGGHRAH